MNKIMEVAKILGVDCWEEFETAKFAGKFRFTDSEFQTYDLEYGWVEASCSVLGKIIYGVEITPLPYRPKRNEQYWTLACEAFTPNRAVWDDCAIDYCRLKVGNVFRTKEAAEQNRARIYKELTGKDLQA